MMAVSAQEQLRERIAELESELAKRAREAADKEHQLERYAADLRETFKQERTRAQELRQSYMLTVRALASAVEARDAYTGRHAERVAAYGLQLADAYGMRLGDEPEIEFGFLLHDAGKVAVPDAILFKPGRLTSAERLIIEQHPVTGSEIVRDIEFLGAARDVIRHHHERWDGTGYPDKLAGDAIPISARIFAVADTLDALTTDRPYRPAGTFAGARELIAAGAGTQFCPASVDALGAVPDESLEELLAGIA
jgi:ribonuclease P protein subunit RPR2